MISAKALSCEKPSGCSELYRARHEEDAPRLFSAQGDGIRGFLVPRTSSGIEQEVIPNLPALNDFFKLKLSEKPYGMVFYIFEQKDSWSRFNFSKEMFDRILQLHDVFPPFLDCFQSFGLKSGEDTRVWDGFYYKASFCPELCYTIRYYERNGRDSGNPWSLRQTAVYQKYDRGEDRWTWFLIQPSHLFLSQLERNLNHDAVYRSQHNPNPLWIHETCLMLGLSSFGEYVDSVHSDVVQMSHKACFSVVGRPTKHDFEVAFQDLQKLQLLKRKLLRATNVLQASLSVCKKLQQRSLGEESGSFDELANCDSLIEVHTRRVAMSLKTAEDTGGLLSKVLDARRDEVLLQTNAAMQANLEVLKHIAFISGEENQKLSKISSHTLKDSNTLKALTTIATMYLPASLVATIFGGSLVQIQAQKKGFVVAKEFWIYILVTLLLTLLTGGFLVLLKRPWRAHVPSNLNP